MFEREQTFVSIASKDYAVLKIHGLIVHITPTKWQHSYNLEDGQLVIPTNTIIGELLFYPFNRSYYTEGTTYISLMKGLMGFGAIFKELDARSRETEGGISYPEYFIDASGTNSRMANIARHLGFRIGEDPYDSGFVEVVGRVDEVRRNFEQLKANHKVIERIKSRAIREQSFH